MNKDKVIIVASGPSVKELKEHDGLQTLVYSNTHIIAVNGAIDYLSGCADSFFTLDPSPDNIRRLKTYNNITRYCALGENQNLKLPFGVTQLTRLSNKKKTSLTAGTPEYWFERWSCLPGLSENKNAINTGNSAYGALGLAYHWRPKKILLLGVDGTSENRVAEQTPTRYNISHLPLLFETAVSQLKSNNIQVVNGSINSMVTCFPRMTVTEGMKWITREE